MSNRAPPPFKMANVASIISGPIPSPRATVMDVFLNISRQELRVTMRGSTPNPPLEPLTHEK